MEGVISSRNYSPGDVIHSEPAFAKVLDRRLKDSMCEFCCKPSFTLKACKACLAVKYCGKECQKNDWSSHKLECEHLKNLPNVGTADFVRLLGKVIFKIKGKDWKIIKSNVLGKEISFDDIDPHYKQMTENPNLRLFFHEIKELTGNYIGFENLPDDESLIKIVGKIRFNGYKARIFGLFIGVSMFSVECIPTSNTTLCGNTLKIWASKWIRKGQNKITLRGRMIITPPIKPTISDSLSCRCENCSLPLGESTLFKIIDKKTAYTVMCKTQAFLEAFNSSHGVLLLPRSREIADQLLHEMEGVLGDTNYFYLGLLGVRCLDMGGDLLPLKKNMLLKLERIMRSVFGEYYIEMLPIYKALIAINLSLCDPLQAIVYSEKADFIEQHMFSV